MKTRLDYVSNSSSSSFMLVGNVYDKETIGRALERHGLPTGAEDGGKHYDTWEMMDQIENNFKLRSHHGISSYSEDELCIGLPYDGMLAEETKSQFEARVRAMLETLFGTSQTVFPVIDGGYIG